MWCGDEPDDGVVMVLIALDLLARIRNRIYTAALSKAFARIGSGSIIVPPCRLAGVDRISIGVEVFIGEGSWLQVLQPTDERTGSIRIGNRVSIVGRCTISAATDIIIEDDVLFAAGIYISDHTHAYENVMVPIKDQGIRDIGPVRIGAGSWLGQNVVIGPKVQIGKGSVVGANSVVRNNVPDFSVAVGSPARIVRQRNSTTGQWEKVQPHLEKNT